MSKSIMFVQKVLYIVYVISSCFSLVVVVVNSFSTTTTTTTLRQQQHNKAFHIGDVNQQLYRHILQEYQQQQQQQQRYDSSLARSTLSMTSSSFDEPIDSTVTTTTTTTTTPSTSTNSKKKSLWPKVGDIVRYYDLDGGKKDGQVLVGRISYIQQKMTKTTTNSDSINNNNKEWIFDIVELENVGDGYYTDYSYRKRSSKQTVRNGINVSPIAASYVRSEQAYKIPISLDGIPSIRSQTYDLYDYQGPYGSSSSGYENSINTNIVAIDKLAYDTLKGKLIRITAISGLFGTVITDFMKGTDYAILYAAGSLASIVYLLLLSLKTDTMAKEGGPKLGSTISNLRFFAPVIVLLAVATYNLSLGPNNPVLLNSNTIGTDISSTSSIGLFTTVTTDQFAAIIFGFLTYRIPLFVSQIQDAFKVSENDTTNNNNNNSIITLPGSAGMLLDIVQKDKRSQQQQQQQQGISETNLQTIFLISGPQYTRRTQLVERFLNEYDTIDASRQLVQPVWIDRVKEPVTFERFEQRNEFLSIDQTGRYGLTKQGIVANAATTTTTTTTTKSDEGSSSSVIVIDADVSLVKKIVTTMDNVRVVGVWVGLNDVRDFEDQIKQDIKSGTIIIPDGETQETIIRARIKEIVQEIEYGISCGVFEFTIINTNENDSINQLREAVSYCFV